MAAVQVEELIIAVEEVVRSDVGLDVGVALGFDVGLVEY